MKIAICGSLDFTHEIKNLADDLGAQGHEVEIPLTSRRILNGEATVEQIKNEKEQGTSLTVLSSLTRYESTGRSLNKRTLSWSQITARKG